MELERLERQLGLEFGNRKLLQQALIHPSFSGENPEQVDNQRLEFLGDAVIGLIVSAHLYRAHPTFPEGTLTNLRSKIVRKEALAQIARSLQLGQFLSLGRGKISEEGPSNPAILADAMEALVGAIFLDRGLDVVEEFLMPLVENLQLTSRSSGLDKDPKTTLQELCQERWQLTPQYRTVAEEGPDHAKEFTVEVVIGAKTAGRGIGPNRQEAEMAAALEALQGDFGLLEDKLRKD
jgi:ribonuclease-3